MFHPVISKSQCKEKIVLRQAQGTKEHKKQTQSKKSSQGWS
jgi:hypothetical protein